VAGVEVTAEHLELLHPPNAPTAGGGRDVVRDPQQAGRHVVPSGIGLCADPLEQRARVAVHAKVAQG
jgi:hypothetical protein